MEKPSPLRPLLRRFALVAVTTAILALVSGCARRESAADVAVREKHLLRSLGAQEPALDPALAETLAAGTMLKAVLEGLVDHDPATLEPRPATAESWDVSPDGLVYTFHLRPGARWSNGDPVTAEDFAGSFRRVLAPDLGATNAPMMHVLRGARAYNAGTTSDPSTLGIEVLDAHTLRLTLEAPCPHFLALLTYPVWLPAHLPSVRAAGSETDRANRWANSPGYVGNGPFRLAEYRPGQFVRVEANPHYWDAGHVSLNAVTFYVFSVEAEERAFRGGQIHMTDALPIGKLAGWRERSPESVRVAPSFGLYFYRVNVTRPPFDDPRVRRALALAVNRTTLVRDLLAGAYEPAHSFTPPGPAGYRPPALIQDDPELARRLLAEAGYPGGAGLRPIEVLFNTSENHRSIAEMLQQMWSRELGLSVQLANQDYGVFTDNRKALRYDLARSPWFGDYLDPLSFLQIMTSGNPNNQTGWSNASYDALVAEAARTQDMARRLQLYAQAETLLLEEAPVIPLFVYSTVRLVDPRVRGWFDNPLDQHPYKALSLEPAAP